MRPALLVLAFVTAVLLAACGGGGSNKDTPATTGPLVGSGAKLKVVATTTQIGDFTRNIAGDHIELTTLVQPNQDPHTLELSKEQTDRVKAANLVLRNGLGLDAFVDKAIDAKKQRVIDLSTLVDTQPRRTEKTVIDPHYWFDVQNAITMADGIEKALAAADPDNAGAYTTNAAAYRQKLADLNEEMFRLAAGVPPSCRHLITNHDALGYFGSSFTYEIEANVIPSLSTKDGATGKDIAAAVEKAQRFHVSVVFAEASSDSKLIEEVARQAGVRVVYGIYTDSLGPPGSDGATYIDAMLSDGRKIAEAIKTCHE
ncbi:MAG TPA: metal ABC transporter substrate-binding protein [Dehalococcoidia bacterium]|nr:metal ABC transporter substrate-binding protein [Dehalococcoidia bacterium]